MLSLVSKESIAQTKSVLFIGNSYTNVNNLPNLLKEVAKSAGDTVISESHTPGGRQIWQHANDPEVFNLIRSRNWDYVVIQCQSQEPSFPDQQVEQNVFPYARKICDSITANNPCTIPLFYMTWGRKNGDADNCGFFPPLCTYEGMDSVLRSNYLKMGEQNEAEVCGVGAVWNELRKESSSIELYSGDESHPSYAGSMAGAYSFYSTIFRKSPMEASYKGGLIQVVLDSIQIAVESVIFSNMSEYNIGVSDPSSNFTITKSGCTFTLDGPDGNDSLLWDFGDGNISKMIDPTHEYATGGEYIIKLVGIRCGQADTMAQTVLCGTSGAGIWDDISVLTYPNPSNGSIVLANGYFIESAINNIGESIPFQNTENIYSFSGFKGILFLRLLNDRGEYITKKIIVE
ncbi:MAG: hypothetical protein COA58_00350 [Bacteroidetes bacterium]|nr:MAG: hypothetical protein COA58_00350 [Bacteroidota bacterium]